MCEGGSAGNKWCVEGGSDPEPPPPPEPTSCTDPGVKDYDPCPLKGATEFDYCLSGTCVVRLLNAINK